MRANSRPLGARRSIRIKILAIAWVPSLVLLLVGAGVAAVLARQSANEDKFTTSYVQAVQLASRFAAEDQRERKLTVTYLLDPGLGANRTALEAQRHKTDAALAQVGPVIETLRRTGSASFVSTITNTGALVGGLPQLRQAIDGGALTPVTAASAYSQTLDVFHAGFENLATSAASASIASQYLLTASLFEVAEWRSEAEAFEQVIFSPVGLTDQEFGVYLDRVGGYRSLLTTTVPGLPPAQQAQFKALTSSPAWQQLAALENEATRTNSNAVGDGATLTHKAGSPPIGRSAWQSASAEVSQKLIDQYLAQSTYSTGLANDHAHKLLIRSLTAGAGLLVLSLLVFAIVTRLSNRLIQRLRRLRSETLEMSGRRLPAIVERLGRGEQVDLESELPPLAHGTDEIGQVADAFNQAQRTAVAAAVKEAETRAGTAKVFLNIAHRSQIVAHRQLKLLDQAERTQEDPDQLSLLFQLDHLTTRSRRNAENLIILGGGQPGRRWRNPVPLMDVVRSAVGESETYTGIAIGAVPDVAVSGAAVADVIHLLAELVDNATSFSPPTARVEVRSNMAGRGVVIEIEDQGLGIEPDQLAELNQMLQRPPDFGVMALSEEPRLGLFVVTQLAVRHGVRVTLAESRSYGGIRAVVLIPMELITSTRALGELGSGDDSDQLDLREGIQGRSEVIGSVLPSRRTSRMLSRAPASAPPAVPSAPSGESPSYRGSLPQRPAPPRTFPPTAAPTPARGFAATLRPGARQEGERNTAEIPVIRPGQPAPATGSVPSPSAPTGSPQAGPAHSAPPSGQFARPPAPASPQNRPATGPVGLGTDSRRPDLPRRTKQTHLAPQLLREARPGPAAAPPSLGDTQPTPENARDRMAAFQLGTRRGRQTDPDLRS